MIIEGREAKIDVPDDHSMCDHRSRPIELFGEDGDVVWRGRGFLCLVQGQFVTVPDDAS